MAHIVPVQLLSHRFVKSTLASEADQNGIQANLKNKGRWEAGLTWCCAPSKGETRINTAFLLTLKRVFLPMDANAERQYVSVICTEIGSASIIISAFLLSVMPANMQTSGMKRRNGR